LSPTLTDTLVFKGPEPAEKPRRLRRVFYAVLLALASGALLSASGLAANPASGTLTRITTASESIRTSRMPSLSANGDKIAFVSDSDFLGQGIQHMKYEIWLYDTTTMTVTRITTASGGDRQSGYPSLSGDGTRVAFRSDSDFLSQGVPNDQYEIWLYDTATTAFTRVTTASASNRQSSYPSLSADGTRVAFRSDADFLGQGIQDEQYDIWLYDTATVTLTRVTSASDSNRDGDEYPSISDDGTKIAFASDSDFLGQGIPDNQYEIWLYDTATMTVTRITTASTAERGSVHPSLNADGTKIAFFSNSDFLSQGIGPMQYEIWLYDTTTMTFTRVTTASDSSRSSRDPALSADGTRVAFRSNSDFLGQGIPADQSEVWLYDTATMTVTRITAASPSGRDSYDPSLNADGTRVAFRSDSDFLGQGIALYQYEIWLYREYARVYLPLVLGRSQ
jgi:Tol biopolymer transport system component